MSQPALIPKEKRVLRTPSRHAVVLLFATMGTNLFCAMPVQALAERAVLIEETFEETTLGARMDPAAEVINQTGISPSVGGKVAAWIGDDAEIITAWDGLALQFRDTRDEGSLRLLFKTSGVDPVTSGELEVSMDFRIEGEVVSPGEGTLLSIRMRALPNQEYCRVDLIGPDLQVVVSDGWDRPAHKALRKEQGFAALNTVYRLRMLLSFDRSIYNLFIEDKKTGKVLFEKTGLKFQILELDANGLGECLLNIYGAAGKGPEALNPVTIDNILVEH